MQLTPSQVANRIRDSLTANEGRVQTIPILVFPDGTMHCEPGESLLAKRAAQFMAASMSIDPDRKRSYDDHAKNGIAAARAFFRALSDDVAAQKAKADAEKKAELDAMPSGILLAGSSE